MARVHFSSTASCPLSFGQDVALGPFLGGASQADSPLSQLFPWLTSWDENHGTPGWKPIFRTRYALPAFLPKLSGWRETDAAVLCHNLILQALFYEIHVSLPTTLPKAPSAAAVEIPLAQIQQV